MDLYLKAKILSNAIIDAVVGTDPALVDSARTWLCFHHRPTIDQSVDPLGFVCICSELGLCWRRLRRDLIRASRIDPPKRKLCIVSSRKLPYHESHEDLHSDRDSQDYGGIPSVCQKAMCSRKA
jgi:hypothetical protein